MAYSIRGNKKNITEGLTFVGSGFAGYTHIDKTNNSYITDSTPLLTSSFTIGLAKSNLAWIKHNTECLEKLNEKYQRVLFFSLP